MNRNEDTFVDLKVWGGAGGGTLKKISGVFI